MPGGAQDRLAQPLDAEDGQQRADHQPQRAERDEGERRAEHSDHDGQHDQRGRHALKGGPPLPGQAGREHDREGLDGLHRAGHENGQGEGELVHGTSRLAATGSTIAGQVRPSTPQHSQGKTARAK